ncbi:hypothetical protein ASG22_14935 [Chryseobacterium sp. Leaf405]|uniref:T9SS type A sorting domain-containing protein n=1 Tax=Chryseobacterium sp. Leaf405 TaxID=1736367 RepID=UPI0006FBFAEF|nr:T9SS type A sorting domain-containing protein [Chryseobacterium sp. Leaf405]KQT22550.1 hypothetical protein ASG22_14935 [Chryseobacterium sp. Leaf405]
MKKIYFLILLFLFAISYAQTFAIDQTFGSGGYTKYQSSASTSVVMLPDGQFITATTSSNAVQIKKINQNGIIDTGFGTKYVDMDPNSTVKTEAVKKIILHNNKITLVGRVNATPNHSAYELFVARINLDGTMDTTFGTNGFTTFTVGSNSTAVDAVIDSNGFLYFHVTQNSSNFIAKINSNGAMDNSFGTNGILPISSFSCYKVEVQNDGKIMLAGFKTNTTSNTRESYLERRLPDGTLDAGFGNNGIVIIPNTTGTIAKNFSYDYANNSITILHQTSDSSLYTRLFLSKIRISDGSLISGFGNNGVTSNYLYTNASDIMIDKFIVLPNSKMIAVGNMSNFFGSNGTFIAQLFVARFNADGNVDNSFANYGYQMFLTTPPNTSVRADYLNNIFITNDGSLVIAYSGNSATHGYSSYLIKLNNAYLSVKSASAKSDNQRLILYPNPASQFISVQNKKHENNNFEYDIIDLSGKMIRKGESKFNSQINVQDLMLGNYIIQIRHEKEDKQSLQFIKK